MAAPMQFLTDRALRRVCIRELRQATCLRKCWNPNDPTNIQRHLQRSHCEVLRCDSWSRSFGSSGLWQSKSAAGETGDRAAAGGAARLDGPWRPDALSTTPRHGQQRRRVTASCGQPTGQWRIQGQPAWRISQLLTVGRRLDLPTSRRVGSLPYSTLDLEGRRLVLGIETSCDDTGAAVVDQHGNVIGESLISQTRIHVEAGGILPPVARDLHDQNIECVVQTALNQAEVSLGELDAIAATVKPGLILSLAIGARYAKKLVADSGKPFIPVHHMEAHALTARMIHDIPFPFLVLLVSGGHCLLVVARGVDDFLLLGKSLDDAPGDAYDKTARRLRLKNMPECWGLSGGAAIEKLAKDGNPLAYGSLSVMTQLDHCNFSFSGIKDSIKRIAAAEERKHDIGSMGVLPSVANICASFQYSVLRHLAKRVQRALLFCELQSLLPNKNKILVMSGGVASNMFLRQGLEKMCSEYDCRLICPPPKLCTDNGIMIAWNGMEKLRAGIGIAENPESVEIAAKCQLGRDISEDVEKCAIKLKRVKLL